jgi:hypothetical protein
MNPLHAYMSGMINYCPDGTDLIQNPENQYSDFPVCKWRENNSVKNTSDPRESEGARGK